jgi:hypothetical protein
MTLFLNAGFVVSELRIGIWASFYKMAKRSELLGRTGAFNLSLLERTYSGSENWLEQVQHEN